MFQIVRSYDELDMEQLMHVYEQSNLKYGGSRCRNGSRWEQLRIAEENLQEFVMDFMNIKGAMFATWSSEGRLTAVLRLEPYCDGYLLTGLETAVDDRRRGYASALMSTTLQHISGRVYSHVEKRNLPSVAVHKKVGFTIAAEYAKLLDGTVSQFYYTMIAN